MPANSEFRNGGEASSDFDATGGLIGFTHNQTASRDSSTILAHTGGANKRVNSLIASRIRPAARKSE